MAIASNLTPSEAVRLVLHERLKAAVQRVDGGPWDGVPIVTEKDLDIAFATALPPPSSRGAEVTTPARVLVSAICPNNVCHQPVQITLMISPKLEMDDERTTVKLVAKAKAHGHICGQQPLPLPVEGQEEAFAPDDEPAADDVVVELGDDVLGEPEQPAPGSVLTADELALAASEMGATSVVVDMVDLTPEDLVRAREIPGVKSNSGQPFDLGSCDFPGCTLAGEHPGDHSPKPRSRRRNGTGTGDQDGALLP